MPRYNEAKGRRRLETIGLIKTDGVLRAYPEGDGIPVGEWSLGSNWFTIAKDLRGKGYELVANTDPDFYGDHTNVTDNLLANGDLVLSDSKVSPFDPFLRSRVRSRSR